MQLFYVRPKLHLFDTFKKFIDAFELRKTDLFITETFLYRSFVEPERLPCHVILKDLYIKGEPTDEAVDQIFTDLQRLDIQRVIAMGGGSVIDIAKVLMVRNGCPVRMLLNGQTSISPDRELIVLPTTCGTGSEVTSGGIITIQASGQKAALIDERLTASHAVLIPELIAALPMRTFMFCSVDALGHSLESHVSATRGNEFARAMSSRAISMILNGYADMILHGEEFRTNLLENFIIASCMGGMSVNNSGAGPVHALAYPLGEKYKMSHGESIYQFLTVVFGMYRSRIFSPCLDELTMLLSPPLQRAGFFTSEKNIYVDLHKMLNAVYPLPPLSACGMTVEDIPVFADSILKNKQRLLSTSPILLTRDDIIELYSKRFAGEI